MAKVRSLISLVLLGVVSILAASDTVLIFRGNLGSDRQIERNVRSFLPDNIEIVRSRPVESVGELRSKLSSNPKMVLIVDGKSAKTFQRYSSGKSSGVIPSVIFTDIASYENVKNSVPKSTVIGMEPGFPDMVAIAKKVMPSIREAGVLYSDSKRTSVQAELADYRTSGKVVTAVPVTGAVSSESVTSGIRRFSLGAKTIVWISGSELMSFVKNDSDVRNELKRRAGAVITDNRSVAESLREEMPVFYLSKDSKTIASFMAARTAVVLRNSGAVGAGDMKASVYQCEFLSGASSRTFPASSYGKASQQVATAVSLYKKSLSNTPDVEESGAVLRKETKVAAARPSKKTVQPEPRAPKPDVKVEAQKKVESIKETNTAVAKAVEEKKEERKNELSEKKALPEVRVTITTSIANVFSTVDPEPMLMAVAKAGDEFLLLDTLDEYLQIKAWGRTGYIHNSEVAEIEPVEIVHALSFATILTTPWFMWGTGVFAIASFLIIVITMVRVRRRRIRRLHYRSALLLSRKSAELFMINDNGKKVSFKKYLLDSGTILVALKSPAKLQRRMAHHMPDIIVVDWRIAETVVGLLKRQLSTYRLSSATTVLFYHVPEKELYQLQEGFGDAAIHVFNHEPSQQNISMILAGQTPSYNNSRSSTSETLETTSYLAGMIQGTSLEDVLQLIESGRKNGCLVVETEDPFAALFFKNGVIVYAATKDGTLGADAIFNMLTLNEGSFYFMLDREAPKETLSLSAMAVLMEWSARQDHIEMMTGQFPAIQPE